LKPRILWRLFWAFFAIIAASYLAFYFTLLPPVRAFLNYQTETELKRQLGLIQHELKEYSWTGEVGSSIQALVRLSSQESQSRITLIKPDGLVIADSSVAPERLAQLDNHANRPEILAAVARGFGQNIRYSKTVKTNMVYVAQRVPQGIIRVSVPLTSIEQAFKSVKGSILMAMFSALLLACLLAFWLTRRTGLVVHTVSNAAERMSAGDFDYRLVWKDTGPLAGVAHALNTMADNLGEQRRGLVQEHNQLKVVLESMGEGVLVTDAEGLVQMGNPALRRMFGLTEIALGLPILENFRHNKLHESIEKVLREKKTDLVELQVFGEGFEKNLRVQTAPLISESKLQGAVSVFSDITEVRKLENARKEFVANVSHELKTPLTSIRGFAETLQHQAAKCDDTTIRFIERIESNAMQLQNLIEDLLDLSRIESGRRELILQTVELRDLVLKVTDDFRERLEQNQMKVELRIDHSLKVRAEPRALEQIFRNLIDNAIKYSPAGGALIIEAGRIEKDGNRNCYYEVSVTDHGLGIPNEDLPHIFERFYRVDKARSRALGGTGLGLAIVKHLVQAQGGQVGVESEVGQGSRFFFTLTAAEQNQELP